MSYEATFFDNQFRNGKTFTFLHAKGSDIIKEAYFCLQKESLEESLGDAQLTLRDSPSKIIQHIVDCNFFSPKFISDLVKNQHIYTLEDLVEKIAPLTLTKNRWSLISLFVKS